MSKTPLTDAAAMTVAQAKALRRQVLSLDVVSGDTCRRIEIALRDLVERCDGAEGVRADGSNIDTRGAHAALGHFEQVND